MAHKNAPGNWTSEFKWRTLEFRKKALDGKFHGRRPVRRPRLRWEDNIRKGLLVAAECKGMETSRGQELLKRPGPVAGCGATEEE
jgi:hypothetical protein